MTEEARKKLGRLGEAAAAEELERLGFRILARNFHCRGGEADLVAEEGPVLAFVEVKARSSLRHGLPREAVQWRKQQRLEQAALHYLAQHGIEERPVRFDVVEVVLLGGEVAAVEVLRDAFRPE